jgi:uncharacterized protein (DUF58 family)
VPRPAGAHAPEVSLSELAPEAALRRLELQIVRRLEGFLHGEHLGLLPGPGTDLAEARFYVPGEDDVRRMDWAVTARTTIPHVRDVIADRELETWSLVDLSPSMHFGTATLEKRDLAVAAVATMGLLTFRVGDRFGALVLRDGQLKRWPARSGRQALFGLLRSLLRESNHDGGTPNQSLGQAITTMSRSPRRRGLRVVVSDFLEREDAVSLGDEGMTVDTPPSWERPLRQLSTRHHVIAIEVIDPRELDIPDVGTILMRDAESGQVRELHTSSRRVRATYAAAARLQRERTARAMRRSGVSHLVLRTDRPWLTEFARFALTHRRMAADLRRRRTGVQR